MGIAKGLIRSSAAVFFLWLLAVPLSAAGSGSFPLIPGSSWSYQGDVSYTKTGAQPKLVSENNVVWKMSVREVCRRGQVLAARLSGCPADVNWQGSQAQPSDYLIIGVGGAKYFFKTDAVAKAWARLKSPDDPLVDLVRADELTFDFPLADGQIIGEPGNITRQDQRYAWVVEAQGPKRFADVKGVDPQAIYQVFWLTYRSLADSTTLEVAPGLGITRYIYHHNGTPADSDLRLVEYRVIK